jgi:hypothetical protein
MPLAIGCVARFRAHYRCLNCEKNTFRVIDVPDLDDAPRDIDELLESAFFRNLRFQCHVCEGFIGQVIAIKQVYDEVAA